MTPPTSATAVTLARPQAAPVASKNGRIADATAGVLEFVRDPMRISMFLLTILTVSRIHQHYRALAKLRPALLLTFAVAAYAYINPRYLTRAHVFKLWPMRRMIVLGIWACGSAVFGISLGRSASFILDTYIKTLVYAFLLVFSIRSVKDLFTYMWAYVISCGILSFFALFVFGLSKNANSAVTRLDNLYTYDANDICVVMMVGLAFTLLLLQVSRGPKLWALLINLTGIGVTVARSGSRGGFIGLVVFAAVALVLVNSVSFGRRSMILGVVTLALVLGAPPGYWEQMQTVLSPKDDYNYSSRDGRKALAERGIGYTMQYPIFGLGIDNFSRAECTISPKLADVQVARGVRVRCAPPHNSFIQAAAETGVPGFLVWLSLIVGGIGSMLMLRSRLPQRWRTGNDTEKFLYGSTHYIVLALVGFSATAFFVSFAWMDILYVVAAFMAGLLISVRAYKAELAGNTGAPVAAPSRRGWRSRRPFAPGPQPMSRR